MNSGRLAVSVAVWVAVLLCGSLAHAGDLALQQRLAAQAAIERVYYSHQIGAAAPFEEAVPREVIEHKVLTYLEQSAALERFWRAPVTAEQLRREMERQARESRMPGRLAELWAALGNDPFLIQECLARPALVDRLVRSFHAGGAESGESPRPYDEWWNEVRGTLAAERVETVADPLASLPPLPGLAASGSPDEPPCLPDDTWHNGSLDDIPAGRSRHSAVWTGSLMIVWGGSANLESNTGARYDPATSTWTPVATVGAPSSRSNHTAVWTGSVMVVWGGMRSATEIEILNTGGRYNPTTDSWTPTSLSRAPTARTRHSAVWTGSRMLIWGGDDNGGVYPNTGGSYDPAGDKWVSTSTTGAPSGRRNHSAVWTGSLMVVWGGAASSIPTNTGGRYNPATDSWSPTSLTGAPTARWYHSAVWTDSRMVVWGGTGSSVLNDGSRYDPSADTWAATSSSGAPSGRYQHTAVWTGTRMIVWGGVGISNNEKFNTGSRYDPVGDTWSATSTSGAPTARNTHSAVWTGSQMIVWGGLDSGVSSDTGGRYDPVTDVWTPTHSSSAPGRRVDHAAVWTGNVMLIWGGWVEGSSTCFQDGSRYDPALDQWSPTTMTGVPQARVATGVWTGREMVVWGGSCGPGAGNVLYDNGGRYDPIADRWTPTSTTGAPSARRGHSAVWTGGRMIVWGGRDFTADHNTGGRYDPIADSWTPTSTDGAPSPRNGHTAVWTGGRMIVWGGGVSQEPYGRLDSGGRYDPIGDSWTPTSTDRAPSPRSAHTAVWTGSRMIVWGGTNSANSSDPALNTGGRYEPAGDTWAATSTQGAPKARKFHTAVWGANRMIVWGGENIYEQTNTGGRYDPLADSWLPTSVAAAPSARSQHSSVWTGTDAIVWAGSVDRGTNSTNAGGIYALGQLTDGDGDSYSPCTGDCNDASAVNFPGAPELCDGLDNDCDTLVDDGFVAPGGVAGLAVALVGGAARLSWPGLVSATAYDVVSGTLSVLGETAGNFTPATDRCLANDLVVTTLDDGATPPLADGFWYLVRAVNCVEGGTYDDGGAGQSGTRDAEIGAAPAACP